MLGVAVALWVPALLVAAFLLVVHRVRLLGLLVFTPLALLLCAVAYVWPSGASWAMERLCDWMGKELDE